MQLNQNDKGMKKKKEKKIHNNGIDLFKEVEYQIILPPP